jgi:hypothetical protein
MIESISAETSQFAALGGAGASETCCTTMLTGESPVMGGCPTISSYSMHPTEQMSLRTSTASPRPCSGDKYCGVPSTVPARVTVPVIMLAIRVIGD